MDGEREQQRRELQALRAEIASLRSRLEGPRPAARDPEPEPQGCPGHEAQLSRLQSGLSALVRLTGVQITEYSLRRRESHDGQRVVRQGRLAGQGHTVPFELEFQLLETRGEERAAVSVTALTIVLGGGAHSELQRLAARAEEKRDPFLFFRGLYFFREWCEHRQRTFRHFKEQHPAVVQLPEGPAARSMVLRSACVPGFELVVVWTMRVDEEGKITPELDLLTKIPEQALTLDEEEVVARAPRCFRSLLPLLGIEAALGSLIALLGADEE